MRASRALCGHLVGFAPLYGDLRGAAGALPRFSFVTPNLCDDGHDCAPSVAASWLTGFLSRVTASRAWSDSTLVLVTWDESYGDDTASITPACRVAATGGGGHVLVLLCAKGLRRGLVVPTPLNEVAILAFVERTFSLRLLAGAGAWRAHTLPVG